MGLAKRVVANIILTVLAMVLWQEAVYVTNGPITVAWNSVADEAHPEVLYEVVAVWEGPLGARQEFPQGTTAELEKSIDRPRSGAFHIKVRARDFITNETSEWAISTDPTRAVVDGVPRGWRILWEPPAPSGGGIEG